MQIQTTHSKCYEQSNKVKCIVDICKYKNLESLGKYFVPFVRMHLPSAFQGITRFIFKTYSLSAFKWHKSNIKNLWMKSPEIGFIFIPAFYLIIWLMTSSNNFEKISILKIWQLIFFWVVKIYFGKFLLKWCIFRHGKIWFSLIIPFNSYYFHLM